MIMVWSTNRILGLAFAALIGLQGTAHAAIWHAFEFKDGDGWMVMTSDVVAGGAIGLRCLKGELNAVALPVPTNAKDPIKVFYEIDGTPFIGMWEIDGDRAVLKGDAAKAFGSQIQRMKSAMWYYVGDTPKSLATPGNLQETLDKLPSQCGDRAGS
jgi:hypothetical protein